MKRIVCSWSGPAVVGLAVTVLHFDDTITNVQAQTLDFFHAVDDVIPGGNSVVVPGDGDIIDETNGELVDVWSEGAAVTVPGADGVPQAAAGVGACINWLTAGIVNGKRVRGRTFVVPMSTSRYDAAGTLSAPAITALEAGGLLLATGGLGVWHRPTTPGGTDGSFHMATAFRVRDRVAFLSSRRD